MAVLHGTLDEADIDRGLLRLFNLGEKQPDEADDKHAQRDHQRRCSVRYVSLCCITDECTHDDIHCHGSRAVEDAADLYQLVALVAATTKDVEHGVYHCV